MSEIPKGEEIKVAWLRLIAGSPEEAKALILGISTEGFWQQFLKKFQAWVDDGCYDATLKYWGFSDANCASIQARIKEKGVWNPRALQELESPEDLPQPQLPAQAQPDLQMKGMDLMTYLVRSKLSIILVAAPGAGKTITAKGWLIGSIQQHPKAMIRTIGLKNYGFYGLTSVPGFSAVLQQGSDEKGRAINFDPLVEVLHWLDGILETRRNATEGTDYSSEPAWLLITDYTPIANELLKLKPELAKSVFSLVYRLIVVGREYNVGLFLDLHSLNLAILGFGDSYSRNAMALVALGFETEGEEGLRGNYTAVQSVLKNAWITNNALAFKAVMGRYIAESKRRKVPMFWTSIDNEKVGFMPDLSKLDPNKPGGLRELPSAVIERFGKVLAASISGATVSDRPSTQTMTAPKSASQAPIATGLDFLDKAEAAGDADTADAIVWGLLEWAERTETALSKAVKVLLESKGKKFVKEEILGCKGSAYTTQGEPWLQKLIGGS